eukprot:CAMPEP_0203694976 /NCGR_PEP_ID=MMETSP0091-20130426/6561_1 /ASSEMBLY_ACC=CAM_ASM_001089 /TAXON_ID=426623 /ORGANISM="Chaetoceros affinis, Strain CCMP159" /LENGTH=31 /DNA_ID= /DNA_START= /DNA_END= /DNA_ORIENTATION=
MGFEYTVKEADKVLINGEVDLIAPEEHLEEI